MSSGASREPATGHVRLPERLSSLLTPVVGAADLDLEGVEVTPAGKRRLLRVVVRHGQSVGAQLVREGLAEPWRGRRSDWCGTLDPAGA